MMLLPQEMAELEAQGSKVPIWIKLTLTIKEAAEYSGIGENKIRELCQSNPDFVLRVGTKILIKRTQFEQYISRMKVL